MAEYIERTLEITLAANAGARAIENTKKYHGAFYTRDVFADNSAEIAYLQAAKVLRDVEDAPAADVAPVRHGRWEWADDGYCRCSECRQRAPVVYGVLVEDYQDEPRTAMTNFCPNCGAKMDLEGENE